MGKRISVQTTALESRTEQPIDVQKVNEERGVLQRRALREDEFAGTLDQLKFTTRVAASAARAVSCSHGSSKSLAAGWPAIGQARVLAMLDRPVLVELIALTLNHGLCSTRAVTIPSDVKTTLATWQPHLILLDMDVHAAQISSLLSTKLPGSGRLPVIGLSRRGDLRTKLAAFEAGVDDILTVPFAPEELLARVVALLRRFYSSDAVTFTPIIRIGELEIDILKRTARAGNSELHLTSLEQSLLYLLAANAGRVVSREEILDTLWGTDYVAESNIVDRQIRNLRARLKDDWRKPQFIATVSGQGYRFLPPSTANAESSRAS